MNKVVIVSGYFNPLGEHHLDYLRAAKELGTELIVIVNNDLQVAIKGSIPFQDEIERLTIISSLKCVNLAVLSIDKNECVAKTIKYIVEMYRESMPEEIVFCNGGDAKPDYQEKRVCDKYGIEMKFNVGGPKTGSSSNLIERSAKEWADRYGVESLYYEYIANGYKL